MSGKAVISLTTGLEDAEKVTVAFLVSVGAAEQGRETLMFLTKEAVRLAMDGTWPAIGRVWPEINRSFQGKSAKIPRTWPFRPGRGCRTWERRRLAGFGLSHTPSRRGRRRSQPPSTNRVQMHPARFLPRLSP